MNRTDYRSLAYLSRGVAFLRITSFWLLALVMSGGCDTGANPTYQSPQRFLAISYRPPRDIPGTIKSMLPGNPPLNGGFTLYITEANAERAMKGQYGAFQGSIRTTMISSNETLWKVELCFDGKTEKFPKIAVTNVMEVPFPQSVRFAAPSIGAVIARFLSDSEIQELKTQWTQIK